jgi:hypothetical protein
MLVLLFIALLFVPWNRPVRYMQNQSVNFADWQRTIVLVVSAAIVLYSLFSIFTAATTWTSLPTNPVAMLYFGVILVLVPLMAARAFATIWLGGETRTGIILTAIPAVILLLRAWFIGGL